MRRAFNKRTDRTEGHRFTTPRYVSDREAELFAAVIAGIKRRTRRRELIEKFYNWTLLTVFFLLGVLGVYLGFEIASFLWGLTSWQ